MMARFYLLFTCSVGMMDKRMRVLQQMITCLTRIAPAAEL